jgi:UDP-2,3-diacylglucosamine pyrophosphatase LpxH
MSTTNSNQLGRRLFQFALVADTHVNESDGKCSSPFVTNAMANGRARFVLASIARLDPAPAFVLHLGDIVHPVPELPTFEPAVEAFKAMTHGLRCPLHLIPGNHDVGDKRVDWMPAGTVTAEHIEQYRRLFGPDYFVFDHDDCRFITINAQLLNSGLEEEQEQCQWLENQLANSTGKRVFLFSHYPPYVSEPNESGSYDNIDEPARGWLLALMKSKGVEAFFAGHVHNFWYDKVGACEMYLLPATSFMRHDYAELFKVGPQMEFGRNDAGKFGYFLVDVHEHGHVAHFVPSEGKLLEQGQSLPAPVATLPAVHTRTNAIGRLGVDLRHPWAEMVEIAATGGVQEFERKLARNDYPGLALWGMGVRRLLVPIQDFADDRVRARMQLFRGLGHEFHVYAYGMPSPEIGLKLKACRGLVSSLEVVLPYAGIKTAARDLAELRESTGVSLYVSKLRTHEDAKFDGSKFSHFINHGFVLSETHQIQELAELAASSGAIDGIAMRVARRERPLQWLAQAEALTQTGTLKLLAHVRLAGEAPSDAMVDDLANAGRVAEAALGALLYPKTMPFIDTFMDVDRGYFPRTGFIDRRCAPRQAARVYANLHATLALLGKTRMGPLSLKDSALTLGAKVGAGELLLMLPGDPQSQAQLGHAQAHLATGSVQLINLDSGQSHVIAAGSDGASRMQSLLQRAGAAESPVLLLVGVAVPVV